MNDSAVIRFSLKNTFSNHYFVFYEGANSVLLRINIRNKTSKFDSQSENRSFFSYIS